MSTPSNMFDLTGKTALITGGATGIGLAIAKAFVQHGARVLVGSRTQANVDKAAAELDALRNDSGDDPVAAGLSIDVSNTASVERGVKRAVDLFGGLHILVNSAGIMCKKPTFELAADEFNNLYDIHVTGALRASQAAGHIFREQHDGCIINICSISSFVDLTQVAAYAAAKNGLLGLTRSLANEWAAHGIRTNGVAPGFIPTDINRKMIEGTDRGRRIIEHTPMARFGTSDEIAGAAVYLASPAGSFVNGHTIVVDGGYLASGIGDSVAPWTTES